MDKETFSFLKQIVEEKSKELMNKVSNIIENELRKACEKYGIPKENIILQVYPEGTYSIALIVSRFNITNEFVTNKDQSKETENEV